MYWYALEERKYTFESVPNYLFANLLQLCCGSSYHHCCQLFLWPGKSRPPEYNWVEYVSDPEVCAWYVCKILKSSGGGRRINGGCGRIKLTWEPQREDLQPKLHAPQTNPDLLSHRTISFSPPLWTREEIDNHQVCFVCSPILAHHHHQIRTWKREAG